MTHQLPKLLLPLLPPKLTIVVGLGNPGSKYSDTRHNVGFQVVEKLQETDNPSDWKSKHSCLYSKGELGGGSLMLVKPQLYMNRSGEALKDLVQFLKLDTLELILVHDELDIEPGRIKLSCNSGAAGHNGVKDIQAHFKESKIIRIRVGIGRPGPNSTQNTARPGHYGDSSVSRWVLERPKGEEALHLDQGVEDAVEALRAIGTSGFSEAQKIYNRKN